MKKLSGIMISVAAITALTLTGCGSSSDDSVAADCKPTLQIKTIKPDVLQVAAVASLPALDVEPGTGKTSGIEAKLIENFAKQACVKVDWQRLAGPAGVAAMTEGRTDVGAGGWWISDARGKTVGQTDPIWYDFSAVLSDRDVTTIPDLKGLKVGVEGGSVYQAPLTALLGKSNVKLYQSIDSELQDMKNGRIDAVIGTSSQLAYQAKQRGIDSSKLHVLAESPEFPELTTVGEVDFPYTKGNEKLGAALNKYIESARSDGTVEKQLKANGLSDEKNLNGK